MPHDPPAADLLPPLSPAVPDPTPARRRARPRLNALAVASLILAVLLSPLAALFGHIAAGQIARSQGRERGAVIAWVAAGLGYVWLVGVILLGVAAWQWLSV